MPNPVNAPAQPAVVDRLGRRLRYLRVSVTDVCNLSCHYCNPVRGCGETYPHRLTWTDLDFLVDVCTTDLGVEALRITGGEPTVRPGLPAWIAGLRRHGGLRDIAMTTNGILLERMGPELREAGLNRVNVSLDTFDAEKFRVVTRGGSLDRVLAGIRVAQGLFDRVKLNAVALRSLTPAELPRFVEFSDAHGVEVRFIELMPIFDRKMYFDENYISVEELIGELALLGWELEREGDGPADGNRTGYGPATTYRVRGSRARIGFISQMSATKCTTCNKLRVTSDGALKPCLLSPTESDLRPAIIARDRVAIADAMRHAFLERPERYDEIVARTQSLGRSMQATGG